MNGRIRSPMDIVPASPLQRANIPETVGAGIEAEYRAKLLRASLGEKKLKREQELGELSRGVIKSIWDTAVDKKMTGDEVVSFIQSASAQYGIPVDYYLNKISPQLPTIKRAFDSMFGRAEEAERQRRAFELGREAARVEREKIEQAGALQRAQLTVGARPDTFRNTLMKAIARTEELKAAKVPISPEDIPFYEALGITDIDRYKYDIRQLDNLLQRLYDIARKSGYSELVPTRRVPERPSFMEYTPPQP